MTSLAGATQDEVRRSNLSLVLTLLHQRGAMSRSQIVATTGLNRSTVGVLVSELVAAGLVRESAGVGRGVGRPSLVVEPVAESAVVLALDVRVERTVVAAVGLGGTIFARREQRHTRPSEAFVLSEIANLAERVLDAAPAGATWVGTGVGVPGVVRVQDGMVRFAPNLGWMDFPLAERLEDALAHKLGESRGIQVRNDADLGVLAEHLRGAGRGAQTAIFLTGEVGIGGGVLIDGRPLIGAGGYGGEVGHVRVNPRGVVCRCGARGCWETEIGRDGVLRAARWDVMAEDLDAMSVVRAADKGDRQAQYAVRKVADWMGIGLANLINMVNPEIIILGGHLGHVYLLESARVDELLGSALPAPREQVSVAVSQLAGDVTLIGASETAFDALLADPIGMLTRLERAS